MSVKKYLSLELFFVKSCAILGFILLGSSLAFAQPSGPPSGFGGSGGPGSSGSSKGSKDPNSDAKKQIAEDQAQISTNKTRIKLDNQKLKLITAGLSDDDGGPCLCAPGKGSCTVDDFKQFGVDGTQIPAAQACLTLYQDAGKKINGINSIPCRSAVQACGDVADDLNKKKLQLEIDDLTSSNDDLTEEVTVLKANETDDSNGDCADCDAKAAASINGQSGLFGQAGAASTPTRGQTINQGLAIVGGMLGSYLNYRSYNNTLSTGASEYSECLNNAATIGVPVSPGSCGGGGSYGSGYGSVYGLSGYNPYVSSGYSPYGTSTFGSSAFGTSTGFPYSSVGTFSGAYSPYGSSYSPYGSSYSPYGSSYSPYGSSYSPYGSSYSPYGYSSYSPYGTALGIAYNPYGSSAYGSSIYGSSLYGSSTYGSSASQAAYATELLNSNPALGQQQSSDIMTAQQALYAAQYRASLTYQNSAYSSSYGYTGLGYGSSSLYGTGYGMGYGNYGYGNTGYSNYGYGGTALGGISVSGALGFGISY